MRQRELTLEKYPLFYEQIPRNSRGATLVMERDKQRSLKRKTNRNRRRSNVLEDIQ